MGGIRNKKKHGKMRDRRLGKLKYDENGKPIDDRNTEVGKMLGYKDIVRENEAFVHYYKAQNLVSDEDFDKMIKSLQSDLPASFRITGCRQLARRLRKIIEGQYFKEIAEFCEKGGQAVIPKCLDWYPDRMAYQLNVTRKDIRREEIYFRLHNFLISETETGNISRQETVSMIPPLVLDVKPEHKVLDMCAAPGSKTAQLIEALHSDEGTLPTGVLVANDADNARCYMLTHQAKRLQSPCVIITNHDAATMPNLMVPRSKEEPELLRPMKYDRILADVPCTGDGTMRKNPDIWPKWNGANGPNLHGIQYRILKRGLEMLEVGGKIVYSTCSLNPMENEAVLHRMLKDCEGTIELVDISDKLPGLQYIPGISHWVLADKFKNIYKTVEEVPEREVNNLRANMFPPTPEEAPKYHLDRAIRILPHLQNTGAFFVALLEKKAFCPWEKQQEKKPWKEDKEEEEKKSEEPPKKKHKFWGFKEDPFNYLQADDDVFPSIKTYYDLKLDAECFLTRCKDADMKKINLYFTTLPVRSIVENNKERVKIINTGVKAFTRCDNKGSECDFRIAQEGAVMLLHFINKRRLYPTKGDMEVLLQSSDYETPPENSTMSEEFRGQLKECSTGSVALVYKEIDADGDEVEIEIIGWKGKHTIRAYVPKNERVHYIRLVGGDVSKFEKNKFDEKKERQQRVEAAAQEREGENGTAEKGEKTENGSTEESNGKDGKGDEAAMETGADK